MKPSVNRKVVTVNNKIGAKNINQMQGTTRVLYDSVELLASPTGTVLKFWEDVNLKKFPFTNISENKLQIGETIAIQRYSFGIMSLPSVGFPNIVEEIKPFDQAPAFFGLYRSDMSFAIAQDTVLKKLPLHTMYAPFNKDSRFYGSLQFNLFGGLISIGVPQDVMHLDSDLIIPPQIEFTAQVQIPGIAFLPVPTNRYFMVMTIEGLGSLFSPKGTY